MSREESMAADKYIVGFAYGSNMLLARLRERVPSSEIICMGILKKHVLKWHKLSKDGSGKCDAEFTGKDIDEVWGILFKLKALEKIFLDKAEGLNNGYAEKKVEILSDHGNMKAKLYYATKKDPAARPYHWYKEIVVAGARENNLPNAYTETLESVDSIPDPDKKRAAENTKSLSGG